MKPVYLDNAATTALRPKVISRMSMLLTNNYGNASSTHSFGRASKTILEKCRKNIAQYFNVSAGEIVFTSGGTEADNLAMRSAIRDLNCGVIITSKIEHHAVLLTAKQLHQEYNIPLRFVNLESCGSIDYKHLEQLLSESHKPLVSLMHINNEIGNILDIERVAKLTKTYNGFYHTDTVQSVGHYTIDLQAIPVDFLAASAHKIHGPKGVGFCFIRKASGLKPLIFGGEQERGYRAGTEALHNIVGMDEALKLAYENIEEEQKYISDLKRYFIENLKIAIPNICFNGNCENLDKSTYTLVNVCLPMPVEKAVMLPFQLDLKGIACSKGSACQSGSSMQSHVLKAILNEQQLSKPSIRFSFSTYNTKQEIDYVIEVLKTFIEN